MLGGSYNPVHIGHLILAEELATEFGYDRALLVPARVPPHKALVDDPGPGTRLAMLGAATAGDPFFLIDDCELSRPGPSWTVDTLVHVTEAYDLDGKPALVMGDDLAGGFGSWRDPDGIAALADLIVARRGGAAFRLEYPHRLASNLLIPVSSTMVRARIASGGAWRHLVPEGARAFIAEHGLYRAH